MSIFVKDASRAKAFAHDLQKALRAEIQHDAPLKACLDAVARGLSQVDWKTASKSRSWPSTIDPKLAAAALAHDAGMPIRVVTAIVAGLERAPADHVLGRVVGEMLAGRVGRELGTTGIADRAGALVLGPGLGHLATLLAAETTVASWGYDAKDARLVGLAVFTLVYWARMMEKGGATPLPGIDLERSDLPDIARRVLRAVDGADAKALDEVVTRMPPSAHDIVMAMLMEMAAVVVETIDVHTPLRDAPDAVFKAIEPEQHTGIDFTRNWGTRWRRLDAPDLTMVAAVTDTMMGTGWLRITTDLGDADLIELGVTEKDVMEGGRMLGGDRGDDAIWILGVGTDAGRVAPIAAMHLGRYVESRDEQQGDVYEMFCRMAKSEAGRLTQTAWRTLGHVATTQVADDINALLTGHVGANLNGVVPIQPHIDRNEDEPALGDTVTGNLVKLAVSINQHVGREVVILLDPTGKKIDLPVIDEDQRDEGAPSFDHVAMSSRLGPNPWGATAIIDPSRGIAVAAVSRPGDVISAKLRKALDELERKARANAIGSEEEAVEAIRMLTAGVDAIELCQGNPSAGSLELEMMRNKARIAVFTMPAEGEALHDKAVEGVTYGAPKPGQTVTQALVELIERTFREGPELAARDARNMGYVDNGDGTFSIPLPKGTGEALDEMNKAFEAAHGIKKKPDDPLFAKGLDAEGNVMPMEQIGQPLDDDAIETVAVMTLVGMNVANHAKARAIEDILVEELDLDARPVDGPAKAPGRRQFVMTPGAVSTRALARAGDRIVATGGVDFVDFTMIAMPPVFVSVEPGSAAHAYQIG